MQYLLVQLMGAYSGALEALAVAGHLLRFAPQSVARGCAVSAARIPRWKRVVHRHPRNDPINFAEVVVRCLASRKRSEKARRSGRCHHDAPPLPSWTS